MGGKEEEEEKIGKELKYLPALKIAAGFLDLFLNIKPFLSFSCAKMKLSFLHTIVDPNFQLDGISFHSNISSCFKHPQPPNTYTLWNLFAQVGRLKTIFLCFFEECQLISHSSCYKIEICCLKVEVDFPGPRPARAGPLSSIFTQAESSHTPLLYSGWRDRAPLSFSWSQIYPHPGRTGLEKSSWWSRVKRATL